MFLILKNYKENLLLKTVFPRLKFYSGCIHPSIQFVTYFVRRAVMSQLLLLYQSEIDSNLGEATEIVSTLTKGIEGQAQFKKNAGIIDYRPPPASGPESRSQLLRNAQQRISQAREISLSMSSEVNGLFSTQDRQKYQAYLQKCEVEVNQLTSSIQAFLDKVTTADREDLLLFQSAGGTVENDGFGNRNSELERVGNSVEAQRRAALQTTNTLQGGTTYLEKAEGLLQRTNVTAQDTFLTLRGQTEQMRHMGDAAENVDSEITESMAVMHRMRRRALKHKVYLLAIIVVLLLVVLVYLISLFR